VLRKIEIKYAFEGLEEINNFSIETSSDSEWISNENSEKSLGLEFDRI
jgi:hypothetical protein